MYAHKKARSALVGAPCGRPGFALMVGSRSRTRCAPTKMHYRSPVGPPCGRPSVRCGWGFTVAHRVSSYRKALPVFCGGLPQIRDGARSEEHTSELQSLMRISYAVFCLKKKKTI